MIPFVPVIFKLLPELTSIPVESSPTNLIGSPVAAAVITSSSPDIAVVIPAPPDILNVSFKFKLVPVESSATNFNELAVGVSVPNAV